MVWVRKSRPKTKLVKRRLANGEIKIYEYERKKATPTWAADSVTGLIESYRRTPTWQRYAANTKASYEVAFRIHERAGHTLVRNVKRSDILETHNGIAIDYPAKAKAFVACSRTLFAHAIDLGWIEHNPVHAIKTVPLGHWPAWTPAQAEIAMRELPEHLRRVVVLALYTGQRRGDLMAMTWSAYDKKSIRLVQQKTKRALVLPVHPALKAELDAWQRTELLMLLNARGRPWTGDVLSHGMSDALERIGLPPNLNVHGLRKLAAANLADAGCSVHEIAAITGHRTLGMIALYTASADQERLAGAAIVRLQRGKRK